MNHKTIAQYLTEPEAHTQLKSFLIKQIAAIYNLVIENPEEPNHNFSVSKQGNMEPTAVLTDEVPTFDLNPSEFFPVEHEIVKAIRTVEAERDRIWKQGLAQAAMQQELLNIPAA